MNGVAFTPEEFAAFMFLYLVFPLSLSSLLGGIAGSGADAGMAIGRLIGAMAAVVGFLFISMWWASGLLPERVPRGFLDAYFFVVPIVITGIASGAAWIVVGLRSQRS